LFNAFIFCSYQSQLNAYYIVVSTYELVRKIYLWGFNWS